MESIRFTEEEKLYIGECFNLCLGRFINNPLNPRNIEDVRTALVYRHDNIGQIGAKNHEIMHSIFDKMGYCKDGKTTKVQYEEHLKEEEIQIAQDWEEEKRTLLAGIDEKIAALQKMRKDIVDHDTSFDRQSTVKLEQTQAALQAQFKKEKLQSQKKIVQQITKSLEDMTLRELIVVAKEKGVANYSRMKKAALLEAVRSA